MDSIYITSQHGDPIVEKLCSSSSSKNHRALISSFFNKFTVPSTVEICSLHDAVLVSFQVEDVYLIAILEKEFPILVAQTFLSKVAEVFQTYFSCVNEATVKANFYLIYQLLEEMMVNGFPAFTGRLYTP